MRRLHRQPHVLVRAGTVAAAVVVALVLPGCARSPERQPPDAVLAAADVPATGDVTATDDVTATGDVTATDDVTATGDVRSPGPARRPGFRAVRTFRTAAAPVRLRIPAIDVDTPLERVGRAPDGTVAAPHAWDVAAWYAQGPRPGQRGPAVVVGHVDSASGPAVFARLAELGRGDRVDVLRADGTTVRFRVTGSRQVAKSRFPAAAVYSPTLEASLRLITCDGRFDARTGHYVDNLVVTAVPE